MPLNERVQRRSFDILHAEKAERISLANVVNLHNVRVIEPCRSVCFTGEASDENRVFGPFQAHDLERNRAIEGDLSAQVNRAHPALTNELFDAVAGQLTRRAS